MDRKTLDKKIALLKWFSSLEDKAVIDELVELMKKKKTLDDKFPESEEAL